MENVNEISLWCRRSKLTFGIRMRTSLEQKMTFEGRRLPGVFFVGAFLESCRSPTESPVSWAASFSRLPAWVKKLSHAGDNKPPLIFCFVPQCPAICESVLSLSQMLTRSSIRSAAEQPTRFCRRLSSNTALAFAKEDERSWRRLFPNNYSLPNNTSYTTQKKEEGKRMQTRASSCSHLCHTWIVE